MVNLQISTIIAISIHPEYIPTFIFLFNLLKIPITRQYILTPQHWKLGQGEQKGQINLQNITYCLIFY